MFSHSYDHICRCKKCLQFEIDLTKKIKSEEEKIKQLSTI